MCLEHTMCVTAKLCHRTRHRATIEDNRVSVLIELERWSKRAPVHCAVRRLRMTELHNGRLPGGTADGTQILHTVSETQFYCLNLSGTGSAFKVVSQNHTLIVPHSPYRRHRRMQHVELG